ncbi:MAG: twin-arginine translocation pathway signal protein [Betaproteobacteria bacterium]|nr:twin-arginine translocation pathway signal protein [Betaproteobacteria bacterium]
MINRRSFIAASSAGVVLSVLPTATRAQGIGKPARMLIGFPPGGSIDAVGRVVAEKMRGNYAPSVVVENRLGTRGAVVISTLMGAEPDGSVFHLAPISIATLWPHVYSKLSFDPLKDLLPVSTVSSFDFALVVRASVPATNPAEFIQWVKSDPRQNGLFGIQGVVGGTPHFLGLVFAQSAGIELTPVPYKGTVQGIQDLMGGQVLAWMGPLGDIEPFHRAGKVRIVATTGTQRSRFLTQVQTFAEAGHSTVLQQERFGIWVRSGTPRAAVLALNRAINEALEQPEVKAMCERNANEAGGSTPEQFEALIRRENERWRGIVKAARYSPED